MGIYKEGQGMATLNYAFGHDEYAYQVCKNHRDEMKAGGAKEEDLLPDEGLASKFTSNLPLLVKDGSILSRLLVLSR